MDFPPFRWLYWLFRKIKLTKEISRNGSSYQVLLQNGVGGMNFLGHYENWLDNLLPFLMNEEQTVFIDIGANTGQTMLKVLPRFHKVQYYAVEPNPACVSYLKELCRINQFTNVTILPAALSDVEGETVLLRRYADDLLATTTPQFRKFTRYSDRITVPVGIGDKLLESLSLSKIDLIKIDVEGGESNVINGLRKTILDFQPIILCEILPLGSTDDEVAAYRLSSATKLINIMKSLNYSIFNIALNVEVLEVQGLSDSLEACNYLMIPKGTAVHGF